MQPPLITRVRAIHALLLLPDVAFYICKLRQGGVNRDIVEPLGATRHKICISQWSPTLLSSIHVFRSKDQHQNQAKSSSIELPIHLTKLQFILENTIQPSNHPHNPSTKPNPLQCAASSSSSSAPPPDRSNHQSRLLRARPNHRLQQVRPCSLHSPNCRGIAHKLPRRSSHRARPLSGGDGGSVSS